MISLTPWSLGRTADLSVSEERGGRVFMPASKLGASVDGPYCYEPAPMKLLCSFDIVDYAEISSKADSSAVSLGR